MESNCTREGSSVAKGFLQKKFSDYLDIEYAIHMAIVTMKDSYEGELTKKNIEICVIKMQSADKSFKLLT